MKSALRFALALLLLALAACSTTPRQADPAYSPLILISLDGYRADYLERGLSPRLAALAADGVRAEALRPAFPTLTFPNHYTLITGLYPDHHGIVANRMLDPASHRRFVHSDVNLRSEPRWWSGEPLWAGAERQGKHTAAMFWPGADVAIGRRHPDHWQPFDRNVSPEARVDQVLAWLDLPPAQRPDFTALYFEHVDAAGHDYGPDSAELNTSLAQVDAALGRLLDGLRQRGLADSANLVIVSDHGMAATSPERVVRLDDIIDLRHAELVTSVVLAGIVPKPAYVSEIESALLVPHEHMQCWRKADLPERLHYGTHARIPPLLCLADPGWLIQTPHDLEDHPAPHGEHGYDNDDPAMRALFVAHGPAFRHGLVVPEFDNVDVYPLLARILDIEPRPNDGDFSVVAPMLVPATR